MGLYIDCFVKKQGFNSTLEYLEFCHENRMPAKFKGHKYFASLFEEGIIIPSHSFVRTMYTGGMDHSYNVTDDGKLEGLELMAHSGKPGVHDPANILSLKNAPDGWDLEGFRL
jgi:hypothetical protein